MGDVSRKIVEKIKTNILCLIIFSSKNYAVHEIMCKNMVEPDRLQ